jgi:hypothetical protein
MKWKTCEDYVVPQFEVFFRRMPEGMEKAMKKNRVDDFQFETCT